MRKIILISILAIMIGGCATKYQRLSFTGGYSETQLGENVFQISFRGNAYISRQRTSDFCLLRSAEIALERHQGHIPGSPIDLDISSSHDLYFLTMVGWENRDNDARSNLASKNEILIPLISPETPFTNKIIFHNTLKTCRDYIY